MPQHANHTAYEQGSAVGENNKIKITASPFKERVSNLCIRGIKAAPERDSKRSHTEAAIKIEALKSNIKLNLFKGIKWLFVTNPNLNDVLV